MPNLSPRVVGRYALYDEIAAGGMATVHFGRLLGPVGFSRTVAIKRLHPQFAKDPEFVSMFLDEARLAARIRPPNVVQTLDVVATQGELFLVMDYIQGESLSKLIRSVRQEGLRIPTRIITTIMTGALSGLHAAHEARNERGEPLNIVHRDISPQNILVGQDGVARVLDFGVAKAAGRIQTTREGQLKGKLAYMAPEQLQGHSSRQIDVFAAAIVLWEALTTRRLFSGDNEGAILGKLMSAPIEPPSLYAPEAQPFDQVVLRGLARDPSLRWATTKDFANALERCSGLASPNEVGEWVDHMAHIALNSRATKIAEIESSSINLSSVPSAQQIASGDLGATVVGGSTAPPVALPRPEASSGGMAEPSSQMSSISVSGPRVSSTKPNASVILMGLMAVIAVAVLAIIAILTLRRAVPASTAASASVASTVPATPAAPLAPASAKVVASVSAAPIASASAPAASAPVATTYTGGPHIGQPHATATPSSTPTPAKNNCDPPYTLDESGHKKWKPECLN